MTIKKKILFLAFQRPVHPKDERSTRLHGQASSFKGEKLNLEQQKTQHSLETWIGKYNLAKFTIVSFKTI